MPTGVSRPSLSASNAAVPTGTVDFPTTRQSRVKFGASSSMTASMPRRSAASAPGSCGVPTQTKCNSANRAASAIDVLNRSRPTSRLPTRMSVSPGSKNGARPSVSREIFAASESTPRTSWPSSAIQAA